MPIKLQIRRGTASQWTTASPTLLNGEIGYETDTGNFKIGDGTTGWTSLAYQFPYMTGSKALDTTTLVVDQANDRIGIGISSPTQKLDVVGTVKATAFSGYGVTPIGSVTAYAGSSVPTGWLLCDGSTVSQTTYADLYALIGTTYGPASGGNFTLPDLRGRAAVGVNAGGAAYLTSLGGTIGSANAIVPYHDHAFTGGTTTSAGAHNHWMFTSGTQTNNLLTVGAYQYASVDAFANNYRSYQIGPSTVAGEATLGLTSTGGAHTHTSAGTVGYAGSSGNANNANLQPSIALNYIIRAL